MREYVSRLMAILLPVAALACTPPDYSGSEIRCGVRRTIQSGVATKYTALKDPARTFVDEEWNGPSLDRVDEHRGSSIIPSYIFGQSEAENAANAMSDARQGNGEEAAQVEAFDRVVGQFENCPSGK